ncbi:MAG: hypothetical protein N4A53_08240 [Pelagimonas sp.]|jgi:hypothetical protein|nr:hypothetical protein [Pelagimonas sp.]
MSRFKSPIEREAWDAVKALPEFTWETLCSGGISETAAREYCRQWLKKKLVRQLGKDGHRKVLVNKELEIKAEPFERGITREDALWRVIRKQGSITARSLAAHCNAAGYEVTVQAANSYCRLLVEHEYLRVSQSRIRNKQDTVYRIIKNTGPSGPRVRRWTMLHDPNTDELFRSNPEPKT